MCGIVGYIGKRNALPILLDGLKMLEYRGYDSAGIAILGKGKIQVEKQKGKIKSLEAHIENKKILGTTGISHTRWATHGIPNNKNAHPHCDCKNEIALVHNGIIENFQILKNRLIQEGHKFKSETDTEVLPHLIEKYYRGSLKEAVREALSEVRGSYAIAVVSKMEPDIMIGARCGSPLIVGLGKDENFLASDVTAVLDYTKDVIYIDDFTIAAVTATDVLLSNVSGAPVKKEPSKVLWDKGQAQKNGFSHYMLKEINEQPEVIERLICEKLLKDKNEIQFSELKSIEKELVSAKDFCIVACGTAFHAGLLGRYLIERFTGKPVLVDMSSEFRYRQPIIDEKTIVIPISQSGETADTLAAVQEAKKRGAKIVSICNVVGSSLVRESDAVLYTHAGPEIGVASTKAYTAQLLMLALFALYLGRLTGKMSASEHYQLVEELKKLPSNIDTILKNQKNIIACARKFHSSFKFLYLGRTYNFPTALEGALKLKEISYIHAEGYPAGEMKHGPIALVDPKLPVVCICPESSIYEKMISNIQEIKARQGDIIAIATEADNEISKYANHILYIPKVHEAFSPILAIVPLQLLAYHIAVKKGCDVDQPRNLAKSVTVE